MRTLSAAVFTMALLLGVAGCKKKVAAAPPPPPPPPTKAEIVKPPAPTPARVVNFAIEPAAIERGQAATLRWSVANSTDININQGIGDVQANGQRQVFPTNTTSYVLTARAAGGADSRTVTVTVTAPPAKPAPPPTVKGPSITDIINTETTNGNLADALFDYDKTDLRDDARQSLTRSAAALKRIFAVDSSVKFTLEGHCDERGSAEYNLGLGDRRATAAKDFLVQLGVPANNLSTISYGKEKPQCTDENEACYQRNRRAKFTRSQ